MLPHQLQSYVMAPWLGAPPSKNLEACSHMLLDGATAMPQGNVEADEGCHKVWAEILLQTRLLYPHPFPTEAKEQPDGAKEVGMMEWILMEVGMMVVRMMLSLMRMMMTST